MDSLNLEKKWEHISEAKTQSGFKALRISSDCKPELFVGIDQNNSRSLILFLPIKIKIKLKESEKEKLTILFINEDNLILIRLIDSDFKDLFNDLIISIFSRIKEISEPEKYTNQLIKHFYKWAEFFEDKPNSKLSVEEIKGLWGELFILHEILSDSSEVSADFILESWKGPFDQSNDFVFDTKNMEVKTKDTSNSLIKISSEFQLEVEMKKGLELIIISLKSDLLLGESLRDLVSKILKIIRDKLGDPFILYRALRQKSLSLDNLKEYNNYKFKAASKVIYDCSHKSFPKLVRSNIPVEITNLSYKIQTLALSEFIIEEKKYEDDYRRIF